jgi:lactaldehyde reductase
MSELKRIILNEMSYFGAGSRVVLADEIIKRGFKKVFVVTDNDLVKFGVAGEVTAVLDRAKIPFVVFSDVKQNPSVKQVKLGGEEFVVSGADVIVAIGGGSPIDTAKAIGIIAANPEFADVVSLEGVADTKSKSIPIIALPTTAGTAAEVTINYVITDEENVKKMVCVDPNAIPILSIVDAELMISMPKGLTAATGMDALTHAIEGYITKGAWKMSDMFELKAIEMIAKHLPVAVENPSNVEAREGMAMAQYIAGMGFSNVGLGLVHGMAHPLGAYYDIPHGVANALLLPIIMKYNATSCIDKYGEIAKAMGVNTTTFSKLDAAHAAVDAVKTLAVKVGIPERLRDLNVKEEDLEKLAGSAFNDVCTPGNPRNVTFVEILNLYKKAF